MDINDFIGVYPNAVDSNFCEGLIEHFEYCRENTSYVRPRNADPLIIADQSMMLNDAVPEKNEMASIHNNFAGQFFAAVDACLATYKQKYSILKVSNQKSGIFDLKIQKTEPGEAYHTWHYENASRMLGARYLTYQIFLNTIEEGGETEFIYQKRRIKPIQGTLLIWPAGFTHTHRGNQPLSGPKYIITTWEEML